jgi:hypothetical protein
MAFLHCHNCNWEQDDFWSWKGYNPVRFFFGSDVPAYIQPRMIGVDPYMMSKNKLARSLGLTNVKWVPMGQSKGDPSPTISGSTPTMVQKYSMHSWFILGLQAKKWVKRLFTQKWWTYKSYKADPMKRCPNCLDKLCID